MLCQQKIGFRSGAAFVLCLAEDAPLNALELALACKGKLGCGLQNLVGPAIKVILGYLKGTEIAALWLVDDHADLVDIVDAVEQLQAPSA